MNVTIVRVARRRDGRLYPAVPLTAAERARAINLAHALVCRDRLTYRQAQQAMLSGYAVRRSLGAIYKDVRNYGCKICDPGNPAFRGG
jgi:hypothetical protein